MTFKQSPGATFTFAGALLELLRLDQGLDDALVLGELAQLRQTQGLHPFSLALVPAPLFRFRLRVRTGSRVALRLRDHVGGSVRRLLHERRG